MADTATLRLRIDSSGAHAGALGFNNATQMVEHSARRAIGWITALAGGAGILYLLNREKELIDTTAKLSDRLGMSTQSLIGLQYGAKLAGVEQGLLNQSLEMFTRNLGEMAAGGTASKQALDTLHLSYKDLIEKSPDEAIGIVADEINKLGTQAEKTSVITDLFGRGSNELLNLFAEGSKGIAAYRAEVEKFGLSFDRVDAAKVEAMNDALTRLQSVFTGAFRTTMIELSDYIEAAASAFVDWATQGEGIGHRVTSVFETVTLAVVKTGEEVERLIIKFDRLTSPLDYARQVTEANLRAIERYRKESGDIGAFQYTQGLLRPPTQPADTTLFQRIQAEEKSRLGLDVVEKESSIRAAFDRLRASSQRRYVNIKDIPWAEGAGPPAVARQLTAQEQKDADERAHRRVEILAGMYADMRSFGTGYYQSQKALIDQERDDYGKFIEDKVLLEEWHAAKVQQLSVESSGFWLETRNALEGTQSALSNFMMDFGSLSELADSVGASFQRMFANLASQLLMSGIMNLLVGGPMAGALGFQNPLAGAGNAQLSGILGSIFKPGAGATFENPMAVMGAPSARGNIFDRGRLVPMQYGAVIDGPTYFPLAGGRIGLMGEDGTEAAMPLKRMRSGRLGVETAGQQLVTVNPTPVRVIFVSDFKKAALEAQRSEEGQAIIVSTMSQYGGI